MVAVAFTCTCMPARALRALYADAGEGYAVNVPLKDGIDDVTYRELFRPIISKIMEVYQPEAVVFQCGAPYTL